jgi:hypothetical protein
MFLTGFYFYPEEVGMTFLQNTFPILPDSTVVFFGT